MQASGSGALWATAATPVSGLMGYVRQMSYTSGRTVATISERGVPTHHKEQAKNPIPLTVQFAWTGQHPTGLSASGASVPLMHLEFKAIQPEILNSGRYMQFQGAIIQQLQLNEQAAEDTMQIQYMCLAMNGPTASGYLS